MRTDSLYARRRGFTLLELLVVLVIAGLLMAAVPPMVSAVIPGTELKNAARELKIALRSARAVAITTGKPIEVLLTPGDPATYAIAGEMPILLPRGIQLQVTRLPASTASDSTVEPQGLDSHKLRFFPDGSSNGAAVSLLRDERHYELVVGWLLGDVTLKQDAGHAR